MNTGYPILTNWLRESIQDLEPILPEVFVIHSTANPGAGDEMHVKWLNGARQHGWANYYLDHDSIRQVVPEGWRAPAQGPTYNRKALSLEMCEPATSLPWEEQMRRFEETWRRAVWLVAHTCHMYGWGTDRVISHAQISRELPGETDHTDPLGYFERYGRTWGMFESAVQTQLDKLNGVLPKAEPWQDTYQTVLMDRGLLAQRRHALQTVAWWEMSAVLVKQQLQIEQLADELATLKGGAGGGGEDSRG